MISASNKKSRILIFVDYYLPGYKSGGPIRTIANLVHLLGGRFDFRIITRDRDATDNRAYDGIMADHWNQVGKASVFYASPSSFSYKSIAQLVKDTSPDIVYLNSFFSRLTRRYLVLRRFLPTVQLTPVVIAPRGEFSPGALGLKPTKKRVYIFLTSKIGLYDGVLWQASSEQERQEIYDGWSRSIKTVVAPNLPDVLTTLSGATYINKTKNIKEAQFVFISRVTPKKNLTMALELLQGVVGNVTFSIYGPVRDENYWQECQRQIKKLPENVTVNCHGAIPHDEVLANFRQHHFFLFPTLGENYGHVILEALAAGCPVLTSDRTFWRQLQEKGVGWDIPLEDRAEWLSVLQSCVDMDNETYAQLSANAQAFHHSWVSNDALLQPTIELFEKALTL